MIKVSIAYPNTPGSRFDMDYYLQQHMPMSVACLSEAAGYCGVEVEVGELSDDPDKPPPQRVLCHFYFTDAEAFMQAFMPHAEALQKDIANYTDVKPQIQFNRTVWSHGR